MAIDPLTCAWRATTTMTHRVEREGMHYVRFHDHDGTVRTGEFPPGAEYILSEPDETADSIEPERFRPADVEFLPPSKPSKVVCVGLNYADHAAEQQKDIPERPLLFLKPPTAVAAHESPLTLLPGKNRIDHEAELAVIIGDRATRIDEPDAMDYVAGFTCLNDLSNRDDQDREQNWVRGKAFDQSCPIGPVMATVEEVPADAFVRCTVNDEKVQSSSRAEFIFSIPELLAEITAYVTLEPGDVVSTGTPADVGPVSNGDTVEVEIEGVGTLRNRIKIP